jgi:putative transposase
VLSCYRYIELNRVRAGLARHPRDYRWSSYRCNAEGSSSTLVTPHECYRALATSAADRRAAYRELFHPDGEDRLLDEIRAATNGNFVLGSDAFSRRVEQAIGRRATRSSPGRPLSMS